MPLLAPALVFVVASIIDNAGPWAYPALTGIVMAESSGIPVPGETTLIAAALLASQHKLDIVAVIALAAAGAIIGDNIGYVIGRRGGRWLLERPGRFHRQRLRVLERGERLFERHGAKAVFFGRWLPGLRVWAAWLAGANRMGWRSFAFYNALGGLGWAISVGLVIFYAGKSAEQAIRTAGLVGLGLFLVVVVVAFVLLRRHHRRSGH
ncbi:MAG TPA: DedA family protein [Solirubrobacteraceae bacterium]|jgi:membrane protein DedA with SNARE-associated domain|nr:DedA family protein [Solirubrobacteraceae bacterium]